MGDHGCSLRFECGAAIMSQPLIPSTLIERMSISVQDRVMMLASVF
jgi:hypothetical protein